MDELKRYYDSELKDFLLSYKIKDGYYEIPMNIFVFKECATLTQMKYQIQNIRDKAIEEKIDIFIAANYNYSKIIIKELKKIRKCVYVDFPYMEREIYEELFVKFQKILSDGMLAIVVNNIPNYGEAAFICECESDIEFQEIKKLIRDFNLENRVDRGWDEVVAELYTKKWSVSVIPIDFDEEETRKLFRSLFFFPSNKELREKGYKIDCNKKRKQVFISYSHNDKEIVRNFADNLRDSGVNAFIDYRSIDYGENILDSIMDGIEESDVNIIFISESYKKSCYGKTELLNIWDRIIRLKSKWIIVKLDDVDPNEIKSGLGGYRYFEWEDNEDDLIKSVKRKLES